MEGKRSLNRIPLFLLLTVLILMPTSTSCDTGEITCGGRCDPVIKAFTVSDPWICPENCPGGGVTQINYSIEFRSDQNEVCEAPKSFSIKIRNVTDNVDLPGLSYSNPTPGVYEGSQEVRLTHDTEYELTVAGGETCSKTVAEKLTVQVVNGNTRYQDICYNGILNWPKPFQGYQHFGTGIIIDHTHNLQDKFRINVGNDSASTTETLPEGGDGTALSGFPADGNWTINLTSEQDAFDYNKQPNPKLCVRVYLRCDNCK